MVRHLLYSSLQSSISSAVLVAVLSMYSFKLIALFFGGIAFLVTLFWSLLFSYPLIMLRIKYGQSDLAMLLVYCLVGFCLGGITQRLLFWSGSFDIQSFGLLVFYGLIGLLSTIPAWNYVRKKYPANTSVWKS